MTRPRAEQGLAAAWYTKDSPTFADTLVLVRRWVWKNGLVPCRRRKRTAKQSGGTAGWRHHGLGVLRPSVGNYLLELRVGEENVIDVAALDGLVRSESYGQVAH